MKKLLLPALICMALTVPVNAEELTNMHITCYTPNSCPGDTTFCGNRVRKGIAAVSGTSGHIRDCAIIYYEGKEGLECLGIYECLDKLGTGKDTVIDIWMPDDESAKDVMKKTGGKVKVEFVEEPKG